MIASITSLIDACVKAETKEGKMLDLLLGIRGRAWLGANALGMVTYLLLEAWILAPRSEAETLNGLDEIYCWLGSNLPLLLVYLTVNAIWLIQILTKSPASKKRQVVTLSLVCSAWIGSIFYRGLAVKATGLVLISITSGAWK